MDILIKASIKFSAKLEAPIFLNIDAIPVGKATNNPIEKINDIIIVNPIITSLALFPNFFSSHNSNFVGSSSSSSKNEAE